MGGLTYGVVHQPIQGETLCGDAYGVIDREAVVLVVAVDGLGHGPNAHEAAQKAIGTIEKQPDKPVKELLEACHQALRGTRGAVLAIAQIDRARQVIVYGGIGNIDARIVGAKKVYRPISLNGIVGYSVNRFRVEEFPYQPGDLLIMHSDGISDRFELTVAARHIAPQMLAYQLAHTHGRPDDDQLMLVVKDQPCP